MAPATQGERETLDLPTLVAILDHLPALESLLLNSCSMCIAACVNESAGVHPPPFHARKTSYTLRELEFHKLTSEGSGEAMAMFLSLFERIVHLRLVDVGDAALRAQTPFMFPRPLAFAGLETLAFDRQNAYSREIIRALCHELRAHVDLTTLRKVDIDYLTAEGVLDVVFAAPNLESFSYNICTGVPPPANAAWHRPNLRKLTFILSLELRDEHYRYLSASIQALAENIRRLSVSNASQLVIDVRLSVNKNESEDPEFDVDVAAAKALIELNQEWRTIGEALEGYPSLQTLTLEIRNYTAGQDRRYIPVLRNAAERHLPRRYGSMLQVVDVETKDARREAQA